MTCLLLHSIQGAGLGWLAQIQHLPFTTHASVLSKGIYWLLLCWLPFLGFFAGLYYLISLPVRRQERARFFVDLLESGFKQGRSAEQTVSAISATQDPSVGVPFHLLAAHLQSGFGLFEALAKVPRLLPPQIVAMLQVGREIGDVRKVMPVCRRLLQDANSQMRSAFNYLLISALAAPLIPAALLVWAHLVLPKFRETLTAFGFTNSLIEMWRPLDWIASLQLVLGAMIWLGFLCYLGGPRLRSWVEAGLPPLSDWLVASLPWRHKRLDRDFTAMLALLLDADVPEAEAVELAAAATANRLFLKRARKAVARLQAGQTLPEALRQFDGTSQLQWRLANAAENSAGFFAALSGWIEALDAKAFQQEQAASQLITTAVVVANGMVIGLLAWSVFYALTSVLNDGLLW